MPLPDLLTPQNEGGPATSEWANRVKAWIDLLASPPRVHAYRVGALNVPNNTWQVVGLDATAGGDPAGMVGSPNSRLVAPAPGVYDIVAFVFFSANASGSRLLAVRKNAAGNGTGGVGLAEDRIITAHATISVTLRVTFQERLNVGEYVELFANQTSGGALGLIPGGHTTGMQMTWRCR